MRKQLVPYFGYDDPAAALDFLNQAFGFVEISRYPDEAGSIMHAEMRHGESYIMLGGWGKTEVDSLKSPPGRGVYAVVDNVDEHHERAVHSGAEIVYPPEDTGFGTRRYRCRDPEGYEWSFGTYAPGE